MENIIFCVVIPSSMLTFIVEIYLGINNRINFKKMKIQQKHTIPFKNRFAHTRKTYLARF